jgi:hypothetical protein
MMYPGTAVQWRSEFTLAEPGRCAVLKLMSRVGAPSCFTTQLGGPERSK